MTHWSCWAFGGWLILSFMGLILGSHIGKAFTVATWNLFSLYWWQMPKNQPSPIIYRYPTEQGKACTWPPIKSGGSTPPAMKPWQGGTWLKNWHQGLTLLQHGRAHAKTHYHCNTGPGSGRFGERRPQALICHFASYGGSKIKKVHQLWVNTLTHVRLQQIICALNSKNILYIFLMALIKSCWYDN